MQEKSSGNYHTRQNGERGRSTGQIWTVTICGSADQWSQVKLGLGLGLGFVRCFTRAADKWQNADLSRPTAIRPAPHFVVCQKYRYLAMLFPIANFASLQIRSYHSANDLYTDNCSDSSIVYMCVTRDRNGITSVGWLAGTRPLPWQPASIETAYKQMSRDRHLLLYYTAHTYTSPSNIHATNILMLSAITPSPHNWLLAATRTNVYCKEID